MELDGAGCSQIKLDGVRWSWMELDGVGGVLRLTLYVYDFSGWFLLLRVWWVHGLFLFFLFLFAMHAWYLRCLFSSIPIGSLIAERSISSLLPPQSMSLPYESNAVFFVTTGWNFKTQNTASAERFSKNGAQLTHTLRRRHHGHKIAYFAPPRHAYCSDQTRRVNHVKSRKSRKSRKSSLWPMTIHGWLPAFRSECLQQGCIWSTPALPGVSASAAFWSP